MLLQVVKNNITPVQKTCVFFRSLCGVETSTTKTRSQSSIFVSATSVSGLVSSRQHFNSFSTCVICASFLVPVSQKLFVIVVIMLVVVLLTHVLHPRCDKHLDFRKFHEIYIHFYQHQDI